MFLIIFSMSHIKVIWQIFPRNWSKKRLMLNTLFLKKPINSNRNTTDIHLKSIIELWILFIRSTWLVWYVYSACFMLAIRSNLTQSFALCAILYIPKCFLLKINNYLFLKFFSMSRIPKIFLLNHSLKPIISSM